MKKNICKIIILSIILTLSSASICFATTPTDAVSATLTDEVSTTPTINLSTTPPSFSNDITIKSGDLPTTKINLATYGKYIFSGVSNTNASLYTNVTFNGVTGITYIIKNNKSSVLTAELWRYTGVGNAKVDTVYVPGGCTVTGHKTGLSSSTYYYLRFLPTCDVEGSVESYN